VKVSPALAGLKPPRRHAFVGPPVHLREYKDFTIQSDSHNAFRLNAHQQAQRPPSFAFLPQCDSLSVLATGHLPGCRLLAPAGLYDPGLSGTSAPFRAGQSLYPYPASRSIDPDLSGGGFPEGSSCRHFDPIRYFVRGASHPVNSATAARPRRDWQEHAGYSFRWYQPPFNTLNYATSCRG
jgi:hypothetical protein